MTSASLPLVSVVVPAYNYARYLPECLFSALSQTGGFRLEVVAVDDGSADDTPEVLAQWAGRDSRIRVLRQENAGLSAARNTGMLAANGDFILFLDADDRLAPGCLEAHLKRMEETGADATVSLCLSDSGPGRPLRPWPVWKDSLSLRLCAGNIAPAHSFLLRRSLCQDTGLFDTSLRSLEDYDYWLRAAALGKRFRLAPEAVALYRQHGDSMSRNISVMLAMENEVRCRVGAILEASAVFPGEGRAAGWLLHGISYLTRAAETAGNGMPWPGIWTLQGIRSLRKALDLPPVRDNGILNAHIYALRVAEPALPPAPGLKDTLDALWRAYPDVASQPLSEEMFDRMTTLPLVDSDILMEAVLRHERIRAEEKA